MEPKQKQYPVVDVTGDRSKVQCWKEQYCHWNLECQVHESRQIGSGQTRDTKGTVHAKRATIKDRNGIDLTEAENIKKRWQEYTEELYKRDIHDPDNHDGVITHLEADILECEVR